MIEAMTLAFLTGWATRHVWAASPLRVSAPLRWSATLLVAASLASMIVSGAGILTQETGLASGGALDRFFVYAIHVDAITFALFFAEGLILFLAVADVCAADPQRRQGLMRALVLGAAAAALLNLGRLVGLALSEEHSWTAFRTYLQIVRVNIHHSDLNAAGSYFAMMLLFALGLTRRAPLLGLSCAAAIAAGLWLSGSRTALVAVFIAMAGAAVGGFAGRRYVRLAIVAGVIVAGAAAVLILTKAPMDRHVATPSLALTIRGRLARTAVAMTAAHPVFGVGPGRFFDLSERYANGPYYEGERGRVVKENAHNNFLQVLAEFGVPGLLLFLSILVLSLRGVGNDPVPECSGLAAGIGAFLVTCLGGHPLMTPHVAFPFWMALGLSAARSGPGATSDRRLRWAGGLLLLLLAASLPYRIASSTRQANVEHTAMGFSLWQRNPDGSRYRWAGGRSTFFIPSSAHTVQLSLQHSTTTYPELEIRVLLNGREANRVFLKRDEERWIRLALAKRIRDPFYRIDLEAYVPGATAPIDVQATNLGGLVKVRRPLIE